MIPPNSNYDAYKNSRTSEIILTQPLPKNQQGMGWAVDNKLQGVATPVTEQPSSSNNETYIVKRSWLQPKLNNQAAQCVFPAFKMSNTAQVACCAAGTLLGCALCGGCGCVAPYATYGGVKTAGLNAYSIFCNTETVSAGVAAGSGVASAACCGPCTGLNILRCCNGKFSNSGKPLKETNPCYKMPWATRDTGVYEEVGADTEMKELLPASPPTDTGKRSSPERKSSGGSSDEGGDVERYIEVEYGGKVHRLPFPSASD